MLSFSSCSQTWDDIKSPLRQVVSTRGGERFRHRRAGLLRHAKLSIGRNQAKGVGSGVILAERAKLVGRLSRVSITRSFSR